MSRTPFPFHADDISALARSLKGQWEAREGAPGHVELLNMLARSAGYRNFQHLRAQTEARDALDRPPPAPEPVDYLRIKRLLRLFDGEGRLRHWPPKQGERQACSWVLWARLPARETLNEKAINERLQAAHLFGDHALLRRWLVDLGLLARTPDGREYRRIERKPSADAVELIRRLATPGEGDAA
jgi:hypothetical protein